MLCLWSHGALFQRINNTHLYNTASRRGDEANILVGNLQMVLEGTSWECDGTESRRLPLIPPSEAGTVICSAASRSSPVKPHPTYGGSAQFLLLLLCRREAGRLSSAESLFPDHLLTSAGALADSRGSRPLLTLQCDDLQQVFHQGGAGAGAGFLRVNQFWKTDHDLCTERFIPKAARAEMEDGSFPFVDVQSMRFFQNRLVCES